MKQHITPTNQDIPKTDKPTPLGNIRILQSQIDNITEKKLSIEKNLLLLNDKDINLETVEKMEKIEEELEFMNNYRKTLQDQLVVIMNEHNVIIPRM